MSDLTGTPISWESLTQWQREVIVSATGLGLCSLARTGVFGRRATTDLIREARLAALVSAGGVRRKSRQERVMRTVLRSTPRRTLSYTLPGQIAKRERFT